MNEKILITCFEPFGGDSVNASAEVVGLLPGVIGGCGVLKLTLPVEFGNCARIAATAARSISAKAVICFGEAAGRAYVAPELLAINLNYASIPDNSGKKPVDEPICEGGEGAYFTSLPARSISEKIKENGVPSALSYSAGAYVCNDLYYRLLSELGREGVNVLFIHVPRATEELGYEAMSRAIFSALDEVL